MNMKQVIAILCVLSCLVPALTGAQSNVRNYSPAEFKAKPQIYDIVQDDRGLIYFAGAGGVLEFDATTWRLIDLPNGSGAYSLAKRADGRIFVGGKGEFGFLAPDERGTMRYLSLKQKLAPSFLSSNDIIHATEAIDSTVFFCSDKFLLRCRPDTVTAIHSLDHFYGATSLQNAFYVCDSRKGLCVIHGDTLAAVAGGAGLKAFVLLPYDQVRLLIITTDRKIYQLDTGQAGAGPAQGFGSLIPVSWLPENMAALTRNRILCGVQSQERNFLFGTVQNGVILADASGRITREWNTQDGIQDNDINALFVDHSGLIWLGTNNGVSCFSTGSGAHQAAAPAAAAAKQEFAALIRSVQSLVDEAIIFDGANYKQRDGVQLLEQTKVLYKKFAFNYNSFRFLFSTNFYSISDTMQYQSRLEGFDKNWSSWSNRNVREYTNLSTGRYVLNVRAMNRLQEISQQASYAFEIKPPWHEAWWFVLIQVLIVTSILLTSAVVDRQGKNAALSENLVVFAVMLIMKYVNSAMAPLIGPLSHGIGFFKLVTGIVTSYAMRPVERTIKMLLSKFSEWAKRF